MRTCEPLVAVTFDNILVATDYSSLSEIALKYAAAISRHYGSTLHVAHAICPETQKFTSTNIPTDDVDLIRCEAAADMESLLGSTVLRGVHHESVVREGAVDHVLRHLVQSRAIDLIVIATQGRAGSLWKLQLGTFVNDCGKPETKPVLLVGPNVSVDQRSKKIRKVLFATDMTESTLKALPFAISLATRHQAQLRLLYFLRTVQERHGTEQESLEWQLREHVHLEADFTHAPEFVLDCGDPVKVIVENSETHRADLIVFGECEPDGASGYLRRDIGFELVRRSHCPVLLVCGDTANESTQTNSQYSKRGVGP